LAHGDHKLARRDKRTPRACPHTLSTKFQTEGILMDITRDPIFRSIMFALAVVYVALATQSVWAM
jgi:hypothetical protein